MSSSKEDFLGYDKVRRVANLQGFYSMDFSSSMTNTTKREILNRFIKTCEEQIVELSWGIGVDPKDLSADYTAPAEQEGNVPLVLCQDLERDCARLKVLKAELTATPAE